MSEEAPNNPNQQPAQRDGARLRSVAVIGGGISGLAAAHRLTELDPSLEIKLFEASDRLGGVLHTEQVEGFLLEHSADNFITNQPWAVDLCRRIGMADELIPTNASQRRAYVVHAGRLEPVPESFLLMAPSRIWPVLRTPILSLRGKLRLVCEPLIPRRRSDDDENLESFATRRLGREVFERLVQPLIGGIYTADPKKLSLAATLPQFVEMERRWGSLFRGARRQARRQSRDGATSSGARYGLFVAPRRGMSQLVEAIATRLPLDAVQRNSRVDDIKRDGQGGYRISVTRRDKPAQVRRYDALIVAVGAPQAARLLRVVDERLTVLLGEISYAGSAIVLVGYRREQIARPLDGFGFVVPLVERRRILACSYSSAKFPGRAPEGHVLLRVFLGGACQPEMLELDDDALKRIAGEELSALLGAGGEPILCRVARWKQTMPQYHVGHLNRVAEIESRVAIHARLELAGNAYRGVGVPYCVRSGERAAERLLVPREAGVAPQD